MSKQERVTFIKNDETFYEEVGFEIPIIIDALLSLTSPNKNFSIGKSFKPTKVFKLADFKITTIPFRGEDFIAEENLDEIFTVELFNRASKKYKWGLTAIKTEK